MKHRSTVKGAFFGWISFVGVTSLVTSTLGQAPPPPIPPPALDEEEDVEDEEDEVGEDSTGDTPSTSSSANPPTQSEPSAEPWEQPVGDAAQVPAYHAADDTGDTEWFRTAALRRMTTLSGSTGLHRVSEASSGAPGTFRMNLLGSYFAKKGFLCRDNAPCTD